MSGLQNTFSRRLVSILTLGLLTLSLAACGSTTSYVNQRLIAPDNMEIAKRKSLAFVEFTGEEGRVVSRRLVKRMARVRIDGDRLFNITGPIALGDDGDRHIDEVNVNEALTLARKLGLRSVLLGRVTLLRESDIKAPRTRNPCLGHILDKKKLLKCAKKRREIKQCAEITFTIKYKVLAFDTASGRRIYDTGVRRDKETRTECVSHAPTATAAQTSVGILLLESKIEEESAELRREMLDDVTERIYRDIAPHIEIVEVKFLTEPDSLAEGPTERFAAAATLVEDRRFKAGCAIWRKMVEAGQRDPALTFNLGACAEQEENFRVAQQFYALTQRHADQLQSRPNREDRNYSYDHWTEEVAIAQNRAGWLHRSQQAMNVLRAKPAY